MKLGLSPSALASVSLACLLSGSALAQTNAKPSYIMKADGWWRVEPAGTFRVHPDIISVRFKSGIADLDAFRAATGQLDGASGQLLAGIESVRSNRLGIHTLRVPEGADVLEVTALLNATGLCDFAEENTIGEFHGASNDPSLGQQWHFVNNGQSGGTVDADVDAEIAWAITTGNENVVVAVLDSGTDNFHTDLQFGAWANTDEIPGNGQDDDNNGYIDDFEGWDFQNNNNNVEGPYWHGTSVTGLITAQTNNGIGIAGLVGGFGSTQGCLSMALGIGDFQVFGSDVADAILYAVDNGAHVITMSIGIGTSNAVSAALDDAWNANDVWVNCSAGNGGTGPVSFPANDPNCISVPATDRNDDRASFSSVGPENFLAAPGEDVYTTEKGNGYHFTSGTSFSSPHIAAGAALIYSLLPNTSNESVKEILKITSDDVGAAGYDNQTGWGRMNAGNAAILASNEDCNNNGIWDAEDISSGNSNDNDLDGIPDECSGCTQPSNYCQTAPNSAGSGSTISNSGSNSVAANDLLLLATGASVSQPAIFYYGTNQQNLAFGDGWRCVGGSVYRLPVIMTDLFGDASWALDLNNPPSGGQISAGEDWHFQFWYRDPAFGGQGFNLSDGLLVPFCP